MSQWCDGEGARFSDAEFQEVAGLGKLHLRKPLHFTNGEEPLPDTFPQPAQYRTLLKQSDELMKALEEDS